MADKTAADAIATLSRKEKETLRLIVRGHDAKSMARELDLSVHTINDRLRVARRKLGVTSSREAARLLFESESGSHKNLAYKDLRDVSAAEEADQTWVRRNTAWLIGGIFMLLFATALILASPLADGGEDTRSAQVAAHDMELETVAREWLALVDSGDWRASYAAVGEGISAANSFAEWEAASMEVRAPLGRVLSREAVNFHSVPAPPNGYDIVRFRTVFEVRADVIETVTLAREDGALKVAGYYID